MVKNGVIRAIPYRATDHGDCSFSLEQIETMISNIYHAAERENISNSSRKTVMITTHGSRNRKRQLNEFDALGMDS